VISRRTFFGSLTTGSVVLWSDSRAQATNDLKAIHDSLRRRLSESELNR